MRKVYEIAKSAPEDERSPHMNGQFSKVSSDDIDTIMDIEEKVYPDPSLEKDDLEDMISDPSYLAYSFMINAQDENGKEAVGYLLAGEQEEPEHFDVEYGKKVVYIEDIVILNEWQHKGIGKSAFEEFLRRAEGNDVDFIEMEARVGTSFELMTDKWQKLINEHGYVVEYDTKDKYVDVSGTYYYVGLRRNGELANEGEGIKSRSFRKMGVGLLEAVKKRIGKK